MKIHKCSQIRFSVAMISFLLFSIFLLFPPGTSPAERERQAQPAIISTPDKTGEQVGSGDGAIHIIPSLSAPSVKNDGTLTIQAVVKALTASQA